MINNGNRLICSDSSLSMPVTLFFSHHEPDSGKLTFVNASHNPPIFFKKSNSELSKLTRTAIFLGFDKDAAFQQATIELSQGDYIVFYTDDVPDATNIDTRSLVWIASML